MTAHYKQGLAYKEAEDECISLAFIPSSNAGPFYPEKVKNKDLGLETIVASGEVLFAEVDSMLQAGKDYDTIARRVEAFLITYFKPKNEIVKCSDVLDKIRNISAGSSATALIAQIA